MTARKKINLALQGGGAHGALTWGALDRLLEEETLDFEGITATSAGAMNAAVMKHGLVSGNRETAKAALADFWTQIAAMGRKSNPLRSWLKAVTPEHSPFKPSVDPAYLAGEFVSRIFSPYDFNPLNLHPLDPLLRDLDFGLVCRSCEPKLFICATNVRSGKIKVFQGDEISVEAILASACLPTLFQAIEIEDPCTKKVEAYWDGGYIGNPALFPLFYETKTRDVLIVHINPIERSDVPTSASDILNRVNEISFNSSLLRELRAIDFVKRLLEDGHLGPGTMKDVLIHSIRDDATMAALNVATKLQPDDDLLNDLFEKGYAAADAFLKAHWGDLNERSSVDLRAMFQ
ncbi:MAG: patatin-like phospholipase family protein [Pseudomonadota bacterium]